MVIYEGLLEDSEGSLEMEILFLSDGRDFLIPCLKTLMALNRYINEFCPDIKECAVPSNHS
jgi:hypothetical protein